MPVAAGVARAAGGEAERTVAAVAGMAPAGAAAEVALARRTVMLGPHFREFLHVVAKSFVLVMAAVIKR
jgi:hypothetical protein